jgi:hypothetical protein
MNRHRVARNRRIISNSSVASLVCLLLLSGSIALAQDVADKIVATVSIATNTQVITYSDLVWQVALQPNAPAGATSSQRLNAALQIVIDQRLILQDAERLPGITPTEKEVQDELARLVSLFPSQAEFQDRVNRVGLTSEQIREIIRQRAEINKYLDFRFRSFTVVSPAEVANYYNQAYVTRFKRQHPGVIVPSLDQVQSEIEKMLTETKIASDTQQFLETARDQAQVTVLNPV